MSTKELAAELLDEYELKATSDDPFKAWVDACRSLCQKRLDTAIYEKTNPEIWDYIPLGGRFFLFRLEPGQTYGSQELIVVPHKYEVKQDEGFILNVAPDISNNGIGTECPFDHPLALIGQQVVFPTYSGRSLVFNAMDKEKTVEEYHSLDVSDILWMKVGGRES